MALQNIYGNGLWIPGAFPGFPGQSSGVLATSDSALLDADEEEYQIIGSVTIDGGGSKTFGTSGSKIGWLPGASITFAANSTVTVGVKKAAQIDTSNGPAARATIGAAAFDVYKALVGGTDTISSTTWREDAMASGTPYTVTDGDLIAICFHLDTTSGSPSVKIRQGSAPVDMGFPACTLVTSGPTYTLQSHVPNVILIFDDGTLGWIMPTIPFSVADVATSTIGNTNIIGNIFQVPFACKVDALAAVLNPSTNAANFNLELYSTPLGTPAVIESIAFDANAVERVGANRPFIKRLTTPRTLSINTDYLVGIQQTTATAVSGVQRDVNTATHFRAAGFGTESYAANSTAGATFAQQNSGKRRYHCWAQISALDDGAGSGSGGASPIGLGSPVIRATN